MESKPPVKFNRRQFLLSSALTGGGIIATNLVSKSRVFAQAPAIITSERMRPGIPYGVACGDISDDSVIIWSRSDRPARMIVEYSTNESFRRGRRVFGPNALEDSDFTARLNLAESGKLTPRSTNILSGEFPKFIRSKHIQRPSCG